MLSQKIEEKIAQMGKEYRETAREIVSSYLKDLPQKIDGEYILIQTTNFAKRGLGLPNHIHLQIKDTVREALRERII